MSIDKNGLADTIEQGITQYFDKKAAAESEASKKSKRHKQNIDLALMGLIVLCIGAIVWQIKDMLF